MGIEKNIECQNVESRGKLDLIKQNQSMLTGPWTMHMEIKYEVQSDDYINSFHYRDVLK